MKLTKTLYIATVASRKLIFYVGKQAWKKFCSPAAAGSDGHYATPKTHCRQKFPGKSTISKAPGNSVCERRWNFFLACRKDPSRSSSDKLVKIHGSAVKVETNNRWRVQHCCTICVNFIWWMWSIRFIYNIFPSDILLLCLFTILLPSVGYPAIFLQD